VRRINRRGLFALQFRPPHRERVMSETIPHTLTAIAIGRASLLQLSNALKSDAREVNSEMPVWAEATEPVRGLFGLCIFVQDADLSLSLDDFIRERLRPAIDPWSLSLQGKELGHRPLLLPMGFLSASNERYDGIALRCVIQQDRPVEGRAIPSRLVRWYDISQDRFLDDTPCSAAVLLHVHAVDTEARLADDDRMRKRD